MRSTLFALEVVLRNGVGATDGVTSEIEVEELRLLVELEVADELELLAELDGLVLELVTDTGLSAVGELSLPHAASDPASVVRVSAAPQRRTRRVVMSSLRAVKKNLWVYTPG